ncbi:siderophore-interacting protein [Cryobacterium melibiosiphilum]|uniref:Siderophore-interacting protein n=1 Tax=Cryobacterium melibiosiphilum TaxID=995039 RepID=A0A3A5MFB9_9MICO|nr:siderophore-interacting protein [Cryobacterium melibiosiphilum]RJT87491.1 siderophore-interacting protein [Cryobacterium melibiosiphilum]
MLTSTIASAVPSPVPALVGGQPSPSVRPSFRPYDVSVAAVTRLSDNFTRVTFTGAELHEFGTAGLDQRIKIVLPLPEIGLAHFPRCTAWYEAWRNLPDGLRNPIRTYTVRAVRPERHEIDIDFVMHGDRGPASCWVSTASVGDCLTIVGPDERGENPRIGIEWRPGAARTLLIAGDETAAPAVCSILASLPRDAVGCAFIEVPHASDAQPTDAPAGVHVTWLARSAAGHGAALDGAVRTWTAGFLTDHHASARAARAELAELDLDRDILWDIPAEPVAVDDAGLSGHLYAWLAGEASVIKGLRRFLVTDTGVDRRQVAFMGYWRDGRAEHA